jgi:MSHA biogenesis protein MshQ
MVTLNLSGPGVGNRGWVDLRVNLSGAASGNTCSGGVSSAATTANMPWLQGAWTGTAYDNDPTARATFGVYANPSQFIYLREMY